MGSKGSVIPYFLKKRHEGILPITNSKMTRFNISLNEGVDMIFHALNNSWGGEIFIPKIPSFNILDLANAIAPECEHKIIGIRPGEKIHEEMITPSDSFSTYDMGKYYVILPQNPTWKIKEFIKKFNAIGVKQGFSYNSESNPIKLSVDELRQLIKININEKI